MEASKPTARAAITVLATAFVVALAGPALSQAQYPPTNPPPTRVLPTGEERSPTPTSDVSPTPGRTASPTPTEEEEEEEEVEVLPTVITSPPPAQEGQPPAAPAVEETAGPAPQPEAEVAPEVRERGGLPVTGAALGWLAAIGTGAIAMGTIGVRRARRRQD
jgi:hypothetical protein